MTPLPSPSRPLRLRPLRRDRKRRSRSIDPAQSPLIVLPNLFTAASLFLSLFALVRISEGDPVSACWLILAAAVCDAVDGPVARVTRTASDFGLQFDSLADIVAFGVAPAFLIFHTLETFDPAALPEYAPRLALAASALFVICAAIRLARFNTQAGTSERHTFIGMPTPASAGMVVSAFLLVDWLRDLPLVGEIIDPETLTVILHRLILLLMVALLMVSEVPFPKLRQLRLMPRNPIRSLVLLVGAVCVMIAFLDELPLVLFVGFTAYVLGALALGVQQSLNPPGGKDAAHA